MKAQYWVSRSFCVFVICGLMASPLAVALGDEFIPQCGQSVPEIFSKQQDVIPSSSLPPSVFVGRIADVWMESKDSKVKIWARHNFKTGRKSFVCADVSGGKRTHISIPLVVLHDRSKSQSTGHSLWNFELVVEHGRLGLLSQKSRLMTTAHVLEDSSSRWQPRFFNESATDFGLLTRAEVGDFRVTSLIRYDQM